MKKKNLIVRTDASPRIGAGHLMRCLALAQAWQDAGGQVTFLTSPESQALETRLKSEKMEVDHLLVQPGSTDDAAKTAELARHKDSSWIIVDGYHFGDTYQQTIKDAGLKLLFVDDNGHAGHYYADIVLNQNIHADESLYVNREPYTRLLLGSRCVLLRREFLQRRGWKREIPETARRVLVTLGGWGLDNMALKTIHALKEITIQNLEIKVIAGASNSHSKELRSALSNSRVAIQILHNVTNMPEVMIWSDLAVSAGGSTCWELAFMALPNVVLVLSDNQRPIAQHLNKTGAAVNLGWHEDLSQEEIAKTIGHLLTAPKERAKMAQRGQELMDGDGVDRVLLQLEGRSIRLRKGRKEDCRLIWQWANDPDVRDVSFSPESIPWEVHLKWFESKLEDPDCILFIAVNSDDIPIGQARYDIEDHEAVISISIGRKFRKKGDGNVLIHYSAQKLFNVSDVSLIHAYVKQNNEVSIRMFGKAGFRNTGKVNIRGHQAIHFVLKRDE